MTDRVVQLKLFISYLAGYLVAFLLRPRGMMNLRNFRLWERVGIHITPVHFYQPIPDTRAIPATPSTASALVGIDMRPDFQKRLVTEIFPQYRDEYERIPLSAADPDEFVLDNPSFNGLDPFIFYCMLRWVNPSTMIEVGSGNSTLLAGTAIGRMSKAVDYVCIDPYAQPRIRNAVPNLELIQSRVENVDLKVFERLKTGDILFIDTSHTVRTGGDVCFLFLEVLPRLPAGVYVHVHDIFLPNDYPRHWIRELRLFWNENYLLHAYLTNNRTVEVLAGSHYLANHFPTEVAVAFPRALKADQSSFWFRTVGA